MSFYVRNSTPNPIYVAVGYYDPDCSPITYEKRGWFRITPGRRSLLVTGSAANQSFYIYGEDAFGNTWSGNFFTYVPETAFEMCWIERCQGEGCRYVGFDEINVGNFENYTLNLVNGTSGTSVTRSTRVSKKGRRKFKLGRSSIIRSAGRLGRMSRNRKPSRRTRS